MQKNNNEKVEALKKVILLDRLGKKGKAAQILEEQGIRIIYDKQVLDHLFLTKSAEYYLEKPIGWFKKASHLYAMMEKRVEAHNCLYRGGKIQKDIETIISKKFDNQLTGYSSNKNLLLQLKMKQEIAKVWEEKGYLGKAAELQFELKNKDKAENLMKKLGLSLNELKQYLKDYRFQITIVR